METVRIKLETRYTTIRCTVPTRRPTLFNLELELQTTTAYNLYTIPLDTFNPGDYECKRCRMQLFM